MPKVYVEAYDEHDRQILGNLDGQTVIQAKNYRRTKHYKALVNGTISASDRVFSWRVIDEKDRVLEVIYRPNRKEKSMSTKPRFKSISLAHKRAYLYEYYVTGRGIFPFDMLRYDQAWPATSSDAVKLQGFSESGMRSVKLHSYKAPTIERWLSFAWSVGLENINSSEG